MYKISVIMPIFNVEKYLENSLNSILNQTMNFKNIEVIMVDDGSTDNSKSIMDRYSKKYPNFISVSHEKNSGCAAIPRNTGLKIASGDYIMFLDPDDEYYEDICETLYNYIKKYDADVAFGRYVNKYDTKNEVEKSYSPYLDDMANKYPNIKFDGEFESRRHNFINRIFNCFWYGDKLNNKPTKLEDIVYLDNINQKPILLKIAPAVWTKIYKRELIYNNNIYFPPYRFGEDFSFVLQTFLKANGIVFLNNFLTCKYLKHETDNYQSVSKTFDLNLLKSGLDNLIFCSEITKNLSNEINVCSIVPHIRNWFFSWRQSNLTKKEDEYLIIKLYALKENLNNCLRIKLIIFLIIYFIKFSDFISK